MLSRICYDWHDVPQVERDKTIVLGMACVVMGIVCLALAVMP